MLVLLDQRPAVQRMAVCISLMIITTSLSGCASVPDVTVGYQPTTWAIGVSLVQTVTCTRELTHAIIARNAAFSPVYLADKKADPIIISLKELDRFFADSELTFGFTEDGRLKSVNQSATGQGETITKALVGTVVSIGANGAASAVSPSLALTTPFSKALIGPQTSPRTFSVTERGITIQDTPKVKPRDLCKEVARWTTVDLSKGGFPQISIIRTQTITADALHGTRFKIDRTDDQSKKIIESLGILFDADAEIEASLANPWGPGAQPITKAMVRHDEVALQIQQTSALALKIVRKNDKDEEETISSTSITVPLGKPYLSLPVPKPALFGKQSFQMQLAESGRMTSIGYGRSTGMPASLNALSTIVSEESAENAAKAAALKSATDLISQQYKFNKCMLDHTAC